MVAMRKIAPPRIKYHWNTAQQGVSHSTGQAEAGVSAAHLLGVRAAFVHTLTYLAKKDFCSCGFFSFFSDSCSRRSMKSAVSGLQTSTQAPRLHQPPAAVLHPPPPSASLDSHWSVDRSHQAERGVEHLQVHFILHLRAPAGSRYGHYGDADEEPGDVRVQRDDVAQVGLDHRTLGAEIRAGLRAGVHQR